MAVRRVLSYALPLAAIGILVAAMANGPTYRALSFEGCRKAYARALDASDTARVDQHPYRPERDNRRLRHRCKEIRAVIATDSIPVIRAEAPVREP